MNRTFVIIGSACPPMPAAVGDSDRAALGLALQRFGGPVVACCPEGDTLALIYARAAGAAETNWLANIALLQCPVILVGLGALGRMDGTLAGLLAESNRATLIFDVLDVRRSGSQLIVLSAPAPGSREEWTITGSAVLVISPQATRPPYVSRYRLQMAAQNAPTAGLDWRPPLQDQPHVVQPPLSNTWEPVRPRVKAVRMAERLFESAISRLDAAFGISAPSKAPDAASNVIQADPATCARHLVRYLAHHGFIEKSTEMSAPSGALPASGSTEAAPRECTSVFAAPNAKSAGRIADRTARGPRLPADTRQRRARRPRPFETSGTTPPILSPQFARWPRPMDPLGRRARRFPRE